jgi:hypothetical protein
MLVRKLRDVPTNHVFRFPASPAEQYEHRGNGWFQVFRKSYTGGPWHADPEQDVFAEPNARFWVWHHEGWVKLTLAPSECVVYGGGGEHEEGWSSWSSTYEHHGDRIVATHFRNGRDCDGYQEHESVTYCLLENLHAIDKHAEELERGDQWQDSVGIMAPDWQPHSSRQRDQYAEMMGY